MDVILEIALSNNYLFSNVKADDFVMCTTSSNQAMHIGNSSNGVANLVLNSNHVYVSKNLYVLSNLAVGKNNSEIVNGIDVVGDVNFTGALKRNGVEFSGLGGTSYWTSNFANTYVASGRNVGIGVSTPAYPLHVIGDINFTGIMRKNGAEYGHKDSKWTPSGAAAYIMNSNVGIGTNNPQHLLDVNGDINYSGILKKNGVDVGVLYSQWKSTGNKVYITESNVGIMNTNPYHALDVVGDINITGNLLKNGFPFSPGSQWSTNNNGIHILAGCNVGVGITNPLYPVDIAGDINITGNFRKNGALFNPTGPFVVSTSNVALIGISNLGVGTNAPKAKLHVVGDSLFAGALIPASNIVYDLGSAAARWRDIYLSGNTINLGGTKITVDSNADIVFSDTANNLKNIVVNQIQIGSDPASAVVIAQDPNTGTVNFVSASNASSVPISSVGSQWSSDGSNVYIGDSSNVGIGKSNPTVKLDVAGAINAVGYCNLIENSLSSLSLSNVPTSSNMTFVYYKLLATSNWAFTLSNSGGGGSGGVSSQWGSTGSAVFVGAGSNVGVGMENPQYAVDVSGDINFTGSLRKNGILYQPNVDVVVNSFSSISTSNSASASNFTFAYNKLLATSNWAFSLGSNAEGGGSVGVSSQWGSIGSAIFVGEGSNVGVGVENPQYTVDVSGDINFSGDLRKNGILYQPFNDVVIDSVSSLSTSNAPTASNLTVTFNRTTANSNVAYAASNRAFGLVGSQWSATASNIYLGAYSNVGIGNSTPSYSLDVTGDINFTGSLRQNGVVFSGGSGSGSDTSVINSFSSISTSNAPTSSNLTVTYNLAVSASNYAFALLDTSLSSTLATKAATASNLTVTYNLGVNASNVAYTASNYAFGLLDTSLSSTLVTKAATASNLTVTFNMTAANSNVAYAASNRAFGLVESQWSATASNIYVGANSNVGIGTTSPSYKFHVEDGDIYTSGDVIAASDSNFKTDINKIENALEKVMTISGYTFKKLGDNDSRLHAGVLAQEVEKVLPEVVSQDPSGKKAVSYGNMVALLIEAIKDLKNRIDNI
jgi:hypothetical protein